MTEIHIFFNKHEPINFRLTLGGVDNPTFLGVMAEIPQMGVRITKWGVIGFSEAYPRGASKFYAENSGFSDPDLSTCSGPQIGQK